jgi:hypothetical protein
MKGAEEGDAARGQRGWPLSGVLGCKRTVPASGGVVCRPYPSLIA